MSLILIDFIAAIRFPPWISEDVPFTGGFVKWYGLAYVVGLFGAYLYAARQAETRARWLPIGATRGPQIVPTRDDLSDLMFYAFLGIIAGGRLGYVILYDTDLIWTEPLQIIFGIRGGGMSFHGGFLGVCAAVGYAAWRKNTSYMRFADLAWIGAPIGIGLVRLTNFINQELWGRPTDVPWAFIFPKTDEGLTPRHPSQLYEAFLEGLVLWLILRFLTTKGGLSKPGLITGAGVAGYGIFRFSVEFFREHDPIPQFGTYPMIGELTRGMAYSLPMIIVGTGVMIWAWRRKAVDPIYARDQKTEEPVNAKTS